MAMPVAPLRAYIENLAATEPGDFPSAMPELPAVPQRGVDDFIRTQLSAGNENPLMQKRIPELPPDYQIERRPYRGPDEATTEQMIEEQMRQPKTPEQVAAEMANDQMEQEQYRKELGNIDPRYRALHEQFSRGPATDTDMESVFGPGAIDREFRGLDPMRGSAGMDFNNPRQPMFPPSRRFRNTIEQFLQGAMEDLANKDAERDQSDAMPTR